MNHGNEFTSLLIILGLAFLVPILLNRVKIFPVVVGEILAGLILAQLGLLEPGHSTILELFSNIGLAFLMFLAGMEIDIPSLFSPPGAGDRKNRFPLPLLAAVIYLLTLGLGAGGSLMLKQWGMPGNLILLALVLGATSLGVVLPVLKNRGLMHTRGGQAIFLVATVADFLTVILLTIYVLVNQHGLSLQILSFLLVIIAFILAARIGVRFFKLPAVKRLFDELSHATVQIKVRGAIVTLLIFVVLAESMGIELILGAFLAGMLISLFRTPQDEGLVHKLEAFGFGLFIPIFFILTGANLNVAALVENPQSLGFLPALLGISIAVKLLPALLLRSLMGWRAALAAGFLLNTHLSLEIAVAVIGEQAGLLTPATSAAIVVFAVLTVILMPLLFNLVQPPAPKEAISRVRLIYGWEHSLARSVAAQIKSHGDAVKIITRDAEDRQAILEAGFEFIQQEDLSMRPEEVETVLALGARDAENLALSQAARQAEITHVIAFVNEPQFLAQYKQLGVQVFSPALYRATLITLMARNPNMFDLLNSTSDQRDLLELVLVNPALFGLPLRGLVLPGESLVLSIKRNGELLIPHGSTRLEENDQVSILVHNDFSREIISLFSERQD